MRAEPIDIVMCVEELSLSGEISLGRCSRSAHYSAVRRINEYLEKERANWRVKGDVRDRSVKAVPLPDDTCPKPASAKPARPAPPMRTTADVTLYRAGWTPEKWAVLCEALDMDPDGTNEISVHAEGR